jgi:hypothetical protein
VISPKKKKNKRKRRRKSTTKKSTMEVCHAFHPKEENKWPASKKQKKERRNSTKKRIASMCLFSPKTKGQPEWYKRVV